MFNNDDLKLFRNNLLNALRELKEHIEDENTDAHFDFYPDKMDGIEKSIALLENNSKLTCDLAINIANNLEFVRLFPLWEMSEKIVELEKTVLSDWKNMIFSYEKLGVPESNLKNIFQKYKLILNKSVWEGLYRKGIYFTDRQAWSKIRWNKGGRSIYEYIAAVNTGWIHEDILKVWVKKILKKIDEIKLISLKDLAHDAERIFRYTQKTHRITGEPDLLVEVEYSEKIYKYAVEIQHVTDRSRKKRANLIQVPSHRVRVSQKWGKNYLFLVPYVKNDIMQKMALIKGPLVEEKEEYIKGYFHVPGMIPSILSKMIKENR